MFKGHVAGQKRALRRAAIDPSSATLKSDHRMGRTFLASAQGDANNAVLAAMGYNFSLKGVSTESVLVLTFVTGRGVIEL